MAGPLVKRKSMTLFRKKNPKTPYQPIAIADAVVEQSSPLFALPWDIKRRIYGIVFSDPKIVVQGSRKSSGAGEFLVARRTYPTILLVCRQLYHEIKPFFGSLLQLEFVDSLGLSFDPMYQISSHPGRVHYRTADIPLPTQQAYFGEIQTVVFGTWIFGTGLCFDLSKFTALRLVVLESWNVDTGCIWLHSADEDPFIPPNYVKKYAADHCPGPITSLLNARYDRPYYLTSGLSLGPSSPIWTQSRLYILFGHSRRYDIILTPRRYPDPMKGLPARRFKVFDDDTGKAPREKPVERKQHRCVVM